jgi:DnaA-homolog protein
MIRQLPLNISLRDDATFDNFYPGKNQILVDYFQRPAEKFIYLTGKASCGLTHLLQAKCHQADYCLYVPLTHKEISHEILSDLKDIDLLVLDDIDAVMGDPAWEAAIFHTFNQRQLQQQYLIIASHIPASLMTVQLADLKSRLQSMLVLIVQSLDDHEKVNALQIHAKQRGLVLNDNVSQYLLHHVSRDMKYLIQLLESLDKISLQEKRNVTIPLVKSFLASYFK